MLKRGKGLGGLNLTARIFLITSALLIAVSAITYGTIAYLTPISYIAILEDELDAQCDALIAELANVAPGESQALLDDFVRRTGADVSLVDDMNATLYTTMPVEDDALAPGEGAQSEQVAVVEENIELITQDYADGSHAASALDEDYSGPIDEDSSTGVTVTEGYGRLYSFLFSDGTAAMLSIAGGERAVNQAVEALGRVLPFLVGVIVLISLGASFVYARFITRPIVNISVIARRIAELDFTARWTKRRNDEIGALGDSLNLLSDNLSGTLTELETANEILKRDIDRERELERQRMAFFSAASHELKTPIAILKGQLSGMLAQLGIYQDREKYLARALEVTRRMEGLVKEILTINRIGSGGFSLAMESIDLAELMREQIAMDQELIEQKQLTIELDAAPFSMIQGDRALLSKVLDNVLINAILYSPIGASVLIEVRERSFSVENTGVFIPEESLAQLFTPFYRVEQSRNRKSGGSGLGLYLVKSILDLHRASCAMENTQRGVRFTATFRTEGMADVAD